MWKTNYAKKYFTDRVSGVVCEAKCFGKEHHVMNMCKCEIVNLCFSFITDYILRTSFKATYIDFGRTMTGISVFS